MAKESYFFTYRVVWAGLHYSEITDFLKIF